MRKWILSGRIWLLLAVTLSVVSACDDDDEEVNQKLDIPSFMQQAAASDTFEISTGNLALQKGTLADVKAFGQMIVQDHTMSSKELKALAAQKGVVIPKTIPQEKLAKITLLSGLSGPAFDRTFAAQQVDAHKEAIALFEQADQDIADAQVQAFVDKSLPILRMHLQHAEQLKDKTD
jgi:putative membrane protein